MEMTDAENKPVLIEEQPASVEQKEKLKLPKKKKKRRWLRRLIALAVVVSLVGAVVIHFRKQQSGQVSSNYLVATAAKQDLTVSVTGTATLMPADSYQVTTLVSGEVLDAPFEEGDLVQKGDLLFSLDGSDAQNSASSAAIGVQQAQLAYQQAKEAMYPTAPISGTINELYVKNGDSVTAGSQLAKIITSNDFYVDFQFSSYDAANFYIGQSATIYIGSFADTIPGTIVAMSDSSAVSSTGYHLRTVRIKAQNPGMITDEYTATATVAGISCYSSASISLGGAAVIYATGSGTVTDLNVMAGDTVTKGKTLCTISSEAIRAQLQNAQLAVQSSQLTSSTAQNNMDNYSIKSPISGTVIEKNYKTGDTVKGMDSGTLAVVYDLSYLKLEVNVDELDISKVAVGQDVEITANALDGQTFHGTVDKVSINGSTANGVTTYPVTVVIKDFGALLPGMNVSVKILGETAKDVLCIPLDAVSRGNVVLVPQEGAMNADNTGVVNPKLVEEKTITLGRNDSDSIEVTSGLKEGDIVLVENQASNAMAALMGG